MGKIFVISDIHSCYTKFIKSIPSGTSKLILLGDLFNKGREQREMFSWVMKNRNNPKYVFVRGNTEVRLHNELVRHYHPDKPSLYMDWLGSTDHYGNRNMTNIVIEMIEKYEYSLVDVFDMLRNSYKWYHIEKNWIMAHAAWNLMKLPKQQNKLILIYDSDRLLGKLRKKDSEIRMLKDYQKYKFIFGHTPIYHFSKLLVPPAILRDKFFYIDNGIFRTSRPIFYLQIK